MDNENAPGADSTAPEPRYKVLQGAVSGMKDGKHVDFFKDAVVPASALSPVHEDLGAIVKAGAIAPVKG